MSAEFKLSFHSFPPLSLTQTLIFVFILSLQKDKLKFIGLSLIPPWFNLEFLISNLIWAQVYLSWKKILINIKSLKIKREEDGAEEGSRNGAKTPRGSQKEIQFFSRSPQKDWDMALSALSKTSIWIHWWAGFSWQNSLGGDIDSLTVLLEALSLWSVLYIVLWEWVFLKLPHNDAFCVDLAFSGFWSLAFKWRDFKVRSSLEALLEGSGDLARIVMQSHDFCANVLWSVHSHLLPGVEAPYVSEESDVPLGFMRSLKLVRALELNVTEFTLRGLMWASNRFHNLKDEVYCWSTKLQLVEHGIMQVFRLGPDALIPALVAQVFLYELVVVMVFYFVL